MVFIFFNPYAYGLCLYMVFPNPMPILVLYPNYNGMGTNV